MQQIAMTHVQHEKSYQHLLLAVWQVCSSTLLTCTDPANAVKSPGFDPALAPAAAGLACRFKMMPVPLLP